jgi:O-antigen ligase
LLDQRTKLQKYFFYLLILFLPTQLGRHFWPNFSYIYGLRVDYLSPTLYLTDILIICIFIFWIVDNLDKFNSRIFSKHKPFFALVFFLFLFLSIGVFLSRNPFVGLYYFLKILEFGFLFFYIKENIKNLKVNVIFLLLSFGIIFESLLAIFQILNHGALGGIFYFFGERSFSSQTSGIANASLNGVLFLRPYATFPHPNVLAGFLLITMIIVFKGLSLTKKTFEKIIFISTILIGTTALFLSLSRISILLWIVILGFNIFTYFKRVDRRKIFILSVIFILSIFFILFSNLLWFRYLDLLKGGEAVDFRKDLFIQSFNMLKQNPIFGVGLNNFLVNLPYFEKGSSVVFLQPVHNIFLLVLTETGILGFLFFLFFLFKTFKRIKDFSKKYLRDFRFQALVAILVIGLFDHYFLTLQQGQLIFAIILGFSWSRFLDALL